MGILRPLRDNEREAISRKFHLSERNTLCNIMSNDSRYAVPVLNPKGQRRGIILRLPWTGTWFEGYDNGDVGVKSLTFKEEPGPMLSWYNPEDKFLNSCVLVEDQISAMRVAQDTAYTGVALMGTGLNEDKVAEIQRNTGHVRIALDKDATGQAFDHARKWGMAFYSCQVVVLHKDIKDMTKEELHEVLR